MPAAGDELLDSLRCRRDAGLSRFGFGRNADAHQLNPSAMPDSIEGPAAHIAPRFYIESAIAAIVGRVPLMLAQATAGRVRRSGPGILIPKRIARLDAAAFESGAQPLHALLRRSMRERFRCHAPLGLALERVIAD